MAAQNLVVSSPIDVLRSVARYLPLSSMTRLFRLSGDKGLSAKAILVTSEVLATKLVDFVHLVALDFNLSHFAYLTHFIVEIAEIHPPSWGLSRTTLVLPRTLRVIRLKFLNAFKLFFSPWPVRTDPIMPVMSSYGCLGMAPINLAEAFPHLEVYHVVDKEGNRFPVPLSILQLVDSLPPSITSLKLDLPIYFSDFVEHSLFARSLALPELREFGFKISAYGYSTMPFIFQVFQRGHAPLLSEVLQNPDQHHRLALPVEQLTSLCLHGVKKDEHLSLLVHFSSLTSLDLALSHAGSDDFQLHLPTTLTRFKLNTASIKSMDFRTLDRLRVLKITTAGISNLGSFDLEWFPKSITSLSLRLQNNRRTSLTFIGNLPPALVHFSSDSYLGNHAWLDLQKMPNLRSVHLPNDFMPTQGARVYQHSWPTLETLSLLPLASLTSFSGYLVINEKEHDYFPQNASMEEAKQALRKSFFPRATQFTLYLDARYAAFETRDYHLSDLGMVDDNAVKSLEITQNGGLATTVGLPPHLERLKLRGRVVWTPAYPLHPDDQLNPSEEEPDQASKPLEIDLQKTQAANARDRLPASLTSLELANPSLCIGTIPSTSTGLGGTEDSRASPRPQIYPLLQTAPLLHTLCLNGFKATHTPALYSLPPTITDLKLDSSEYYYIGRPAPLRLELADAFPASWLPKLRRLTVLSRLTLPLKPIMQHLNKLEQFQAVHLEVEPEVLVPFDTELLAINPSAIWCHCMTTLIPIHLRRANSIQHFHVEWDAVSLAKLPPGMTTLSFAHDPERVFTPLPWNLPNTSNVKPDRFNGAIDFSTTLPSTLTHLTLLDSLAPPIRAGPNCLPSSIVSLSLSITISALLGSYHRKFFAGLPSTLTSLDINFEESSGEVASFLKALPVSLARLSITQRTSYLRPITHHDLGGLPRRLKHLHLSTYNTLQWSGLLPLLPKSLETLALQHWLSSHNLPSRGKTSTLLNKNLPNLTFFFSPNYSIELQPSKK